MAFRSRVGPAHGDRVGMRPWAFDRACRPERRASGFGQPERVAPEITRALTPMVCATHFNFDLLLASAVPVLDPASKDAAAIRSLFGVVFLICLAILIVVVWLICKSLLDSRGRGRHLPPQDFGRRRSEIAWAVPPVLIVLTLSLLSARLIIADVADAGAGEAGSADVVV